MHRRTLVLILLLAGHLALAIERSSGSTAARGAQSSAANIAGRSGSVQVADRTFIDEEGPFLALGTTLFWALWGFEHDRARLGRNLEAIADAGFDYVRVLAAVGPSGWTDRTVDPTEQGRARRIAALTDWAYDRYGLRVQWTIFGGVGRTPTPESRAQVIDRFAAAIAGREAKVLAVEIANEGWQNGFPRASGQRELKALAARLRPRYEGLLATTAPRPDDCEAQRAWYAGTPASLVTLHLPRDNRQWAVLDAVWRSGKLSCRDVPHAYANNEPIGPYSSGRDEREPLALATAAALSWASGIGAYVLHSGAGIRGGGVEDRRLGRPANIWETERWSVTTAALACVRFTLPPDLPGWTRVREDARDHPFATGNGRRATAVRAAAIRGPRFVAIPVDVGRSTTLVARRSMRVRVVHPLSCSTLAHRRLADGQSLRLEPKPGTQIVIGEFE
jgi:hypothetical protein